MADPAAADVFANGGGLDALALAVSQQQQSATAASTPVASSSNGLPVGSGPSQDSAELGQPQAGHRNVTGQGLPSLGLPGLGPADPSSLAGLSDEGAATTADDQMPIPPELLEWDDTLTTAERVKLARRAAHPDGGPSSSPQAKKVAEPLATGKAPARKKKKPKPPVGAVALAPTPAGVLVKPKAKAKAPPAGEAPASSASEVATTVAVVGGVPAPPAVPSTDAEQAAANSKKDRGKFKGLGRAWRKGLSISGEKLKTMTRAEIEAAVQGWVPPVPLPSAHDATASGSSLSSQAGGVVAVAASKKPTSAASSSSKPKSSTSVTAESKKKNSPDSATTIPAKRKATSKDEGKSKKSSKSSGKKTILSTNASLSRDRNSSSPGPANGRSRSATADRHGSFSAEPSTSAPTKTKDEDEDEDEEDDALYCLCQEKYDEDRIMLACDMCEQWYHPTCVGLPEDRIELVGQFICPRCVEITDERTTWKTKCQTEGCFKSAVAGLTKYCSTTCGETHLVRLLENAGLPRRHFEASTADAQPPSGACVPNADFPGGPPFPLPAPDEPRRRLVDRAAELQRSIKAVENHLSLLAKRLTLLSLATRRADLVQLDSNGALIITDALVGQDLAAAAVPTSAASSEPAQAPEPYNPKKKKSKFDSGPASNRVCGFDERLVLGEAEWAAWVVSPEGVATVGSIEAELEPGMTPTPTLGGEGGPSPQAVHDYMTDSPDDVWCSTSRKRCDAHSAWHKIRLDDFTLERSAKRLELGGLRDSLTAAQKEVALVDRRAAKRRQPKSGSAAAIANGEEAEETKLSADSGPMAVDAEAAPTGDRSAAEDVAMVDSEPATLVTSEIKAEPDETAEVVEAKAQPTIAPEGLGPAVELPKDLPASTDRPRSLGPSPPSPPTAIEPRVAPAAALVDETEAVRAEAKGDDVAMLDSGADAVAQKASAVDRQSPPSQAPPAHPAPDAVAVGAT